MLRLEYERRCLELTLKELGERAGIDKASLSRLEAGKIYPYPSWKQRLEVTLGVPGDLLFKRVEVRLVMVGEQGA